MTARLPSIVALLLASASASPPGTRSAVQSGTSNAAAGPGDRARVAVKPALLPFSPHLSNLPLLTTPQGWQRAGRRGWEGLIAAGPADRQAARWTYANAAIADGRAQEAIGALDVMRQDEPDLMLVPAFRLALGATLAMLDRATPAVDALSTDALAGNPEACAWRILALARGGLPGPALGQVRCAVPALNARPANARAPFLLAAARAAADLGKPALTIQLLETIPAGDPAANLLRGRATIGLGDDAGGRLLLGRARQSGDDGQRIDADLSLIEVAARAGALGGQDKATLRRIRFVWRGDDIEVRALRLSIDLARRAHDLPATLEAGATLFRYFSGGADRAALVAELQQTVAQLLAPDSALPLDRIAGLYWDYRDLAPAAAAGDLLVSQLADRLQAAGLYERAGELLDHQLRVRTRDLAQGPLSARVASLFILAAKPARALSALRDTDGYAYPDEMLWNRHRVEAIALDQVGRTAEAMAVLQDVPDAAVIRAEIAWKRHDWKTVAADAPPPAGGGRLTTVMQARLLRYATALAMLGREGDLAQLRVRYAGAFTGLPTAAAFAALTDAVGAVDPAALSAAMAAIPSASPAGGIADLIDAAPGVVRQN
ncbi:hypothetical protein FSB78_00775 [Sphingomonas ginsenosidivorax]|uniref:Tetratricopeptide repeat protein n=1 Tax=Sphingomonas ginsenosidivorax TaxID=862135 RepID=A0A5C6U9I0_9SPHN|nr:hypothetical protein [Sphingomonas ginsenosidivorax]TXC69657.1 hypothetical protein FSB78_00775 [Sphingomonas ginsenosidivorax]